MSKIKQKEAKELWKAEGTCRISERPFTCYTKSSDLLIISNINCSVLWVIWNEFRSQLFISCFISWLLGPLQKAANVSNTNVLCSHNDDCDSSWKKSSPEKEPSSCTRAQHLPGDLFSLLFQSLMSGAAWVWSDRWKLDWPETTCIAEMYK